MGYRIIGAAVCMAALASAPVLHAQGNVTPASSVQSVPSEADLDRQFDQIASSITAPEWIGYEVPIIAGEHRMCCFDGDSCCGGCRLEADGNGSFTAGGVGTARLEPANGLIVLYRIEQGVVERIRMFSEGCAVDASGTQVHWLTGVDEGRSVQLLRRFTSAETRRVADGALAALAMHAAPAAGDALIAAARSGGTGHLRGQALFWLAQRAGSQAVGAITDAIRDDPDTDVKKRAVFALSQLPRDEGVPRLIDVARSHSNPAVRKQAFFWLGQSKDPRALAFFAEVLKR